MQAISQYIVVSWKCSYHQLWMFLRAKKSSDIMVWNQCYWIFIYILRWDSHSEHFKNFIRTYIESVVFLFLISCDGFYLVAGSYVHMYILLREFVIFFLSIKSNSQGCRMTHGFLGCSSIFLCFWVFLFNKIMSKCFFIKQFISTNRSFMSIIFRWFLS